MNYHNTYESLPAGTVRNRSLAPEQRLSWLVELMPFLEAKTSVDRLKLSDAWDSDNNFPYLIGPVKRFLCPADPDRGGKQSPGLTHYVGVAGIGEDAAFLPLDSPNAGAFGYDRRVSFKDFDRGLSGCMLVSEIGSHHGPWAAGGRATVRGLNPGGRAYLSRDGQFGSWHRPPAPNVLFADGSVRSLSIYTPPAVFEAMATIHANPQEASGVDIP